MKLAPGVNFMREETYTQSKNMEKSFNLSSAKFHKVKFSSELLPHEIDPRCMNLLSFIYVINGQNLRICK